MPDFTILYIYLILNIFIVFQHQQATALMAENNPSARAFYISASFGLVAQYLYPILFMIFIGTWYWGIGLFFSGLVFSAIAFNLVRSYLGVHAVILINTLGFIGIPISIIYLYILS